MLEIYSQSSRDGWKKVKWFLIFLQSIGSHNLHKHIAFPSLSSIQLFLFDCASTRECVHVRTWVCVKASQKKFKIPIILFNRKVFKIYVHCAHTHTHTRIQLIACARTAIPNVITIFRLDRCFYLLSFVSVTVFCFLFS